MAVRTISFLLLPLIQADRLGNVIMENYILQILLTSAKIRDKRPKTLVFHEKNSVYPAVHPNPVFYEPLEVKWAINE